MVDHSVSARDELHESETSQALMLCFDNAFQGRFCFVIEIANELQLLPSLKTVNALSEMTMSWT